MATDSLWQQSEVVRPKLQLWQEQFMVASNLVKKGEVHRVGERDFRVPVKLAAGGRAGTYNPDGGDLGRGSSMTGNVLISTFFPTRINFELSDLKIDATDSTEVAVRSAFKEAVKDIVKESAIADDIYFHTDATAVAATVTAQTTVSSRTVYTLDTSFGIQRLRRGWYVTVYATGYASIRAQGVFIYSIDYPNKKITLNTTVSGAASTDIICFDGVSGTGSAPAWKNGLYYSNSYATSGYFYSVDRAVEPETIANSVNVAGTVTPNHALLLWDTIGQRRGEVADEIVGLANTPQRAKIFEGQVAISTWMRGTNDQPMDIMPSVKKSEFPFVGIKHMLDYRQDRSRIDWIVPSLWIRARLFDVKYYEKGGQRFFPIIGASGAPSATTWFSMIQAENWVNTDPGSGGVLYGCSQPSGY